MFLLLAKQRADVGEPPGDGRGGGHGGADKVGPSTGALAALEVAVAGAGGTLARLEPVGMERQAHAATRLPPLGAGRDEDAVQTFRFGLMPHLLAARDDQRTASVGLLPPLADPGRCPQVLDSPVRARPDANNIH